MAKAHSKQGRPRDGGTQVTHPNPSTPATGPTDTTTTPPATQASATPTQPDAGDQLGEGGKKALDAERAANKDLRAQLKAANDKLAAATPTAAPATATPDSGLSAQLAELQSKLDGEIAARKQAEQAAQAATLAQLRSDRAVAKGLPAALAKKLTGTTAADLDTEIDELLPLLATGGGVRPNPQQGNPSQAKQGGRASGNAEADRRFGAKTKPQ